MQALSRDLAVAGGVLELLVAQEHLDDTDIRKRLANYIFRGQCGALMMTPSYIETKGLHHVPERIEKRDQSPALA